MLCYRDRTFCSSKTHKSDCGRVITEQEKKEAIKIGLPIAYANLCDNKKEE